MKKVGLLALAAMFLVNITAFAGGGKTVVNGKKVSLTDGIYAKITTTKGDILVKFETELAPMTSANFILLAEGKHPNVKPALKDKKYFDGLMFHRVIPDFMIQGGDPEGNGQGGPGYEFPNEVSENLKHDKGVVSMANAGPNTNGSQFFITVAPTNFLDGNYSIFAKVIEGQFVADTISKVARSPQDKPNKDVKMTTVEIIRVGKAFKKWDAVAAFESGKVAFEAKGAAEQAEAATKAAAQESTLKAKYPNAKKTDSGLMYILTDIGSGEKPNLGDQVNVHYAGYFADGELFDSSLKTVAEANGQYNEQREPYPPMTVAYGPTAQLIEGFKEGVAMLNVGGKATLIIPPSLAYGERGAGGIIPPNAWLVFDIELVEIVK